MLRATHHGPQAQPVAGEREREREREREGGESASIQIAKRVATGPSKPTHQCHGTFGMVRSVCPLEICNRVQRMLCQHHTTGRCGASFTLARTLHVEVVRVPLLSRRIEHHIHRVHTGVHREALATRTVTKHGTYSKGGTKVMSTAGGEMLPCTPNVHGTVGMYVSSHAKKRTPKCRRRWCTAKRVPFDGRYQNTRQGSCR